MDSKGTILVKETIGWHELWMVPKQIFALFGLGG